MRYWTTSQTKVMLYDIEVRPGPGRIPSNTDTETVQRCLHNHDAEARVQRANPGWHG